MRPLVEPGFRWRGSRYIAHVSADINEFGAREVCVYELLDAADGEGFRYVGFGSFVDRFVSYDVSASMRHRVDDAIRGAMMEVCDGDRYEHR